MSNVVVNTYVQDVPAILKGEYQDLLVTSAGSLVETQGEIGVNSRGAFEAITIDGLVYSVDSGNGIGVSLSGEATTLFVNGQVQGDLGVDATGTGDSVNVGSQGSIESLSGGLAVVLMGNPSGPVDTDYSLTNAGDISAGFATNSVAVYVYDGGGDLINNSGQISGTLAIQCLGNVGAETVENSGTIEGLLFFSDLSGTDIDNEGTITNSGYAIELEFDILDINNSGTIHGGLNSVSRVIVENSGHWHDGTGSGGVVFSVSGSGNSITNTHAGTITGVIAISGTGDTIDNAGRIDGVIALPAGGDVLTNSGEIDGAVTFFGTALTNTFTNSGTITGNLKLSGSDSTFTNSGSITGNVTQAEGTDTITNHGQIYGNVALAGSDALINTGAIHGDVTLSNADLVDSSRGEITGAITGATSDLFEFSGNFGNETIDKFTGGTGSTHDTIQFAANDFGSFAAVQSAMSQVGVDTVIRLDATNSITLVGVTKSNLVSADFKFV